MGNNSIRKLLSVTMSMVMVCSLLTGCGKLLTRGSGVDPDSTSVSDATSKDSEANLSENKSIGSEEVPKSNGTSDPSDNTPILLLHTDSDYAVNSMNNPAIHVNYNYLALDKEYAQSHEVLDKALKSANEEILALESECFDQAKEDLSGSDDYTFDTNYYTFFRRADGKYLSLINECCTFGTFDFDYYSFIAHSYYVESGKEIELSDIVADEDAFYAILSEKVKAVVDDDLYIYMGEYSNKDAEDFVKEIKDSLEDGKCSFTLDPQGVTFWFDSNVFSPMCASATVLFCEDADNTIFNEEFSKDIPDEWVLQMPTGDRTYFDANGDGEENSVIASVTYGFNSGGEYEYLYVSGFHLAYEEDSKSYSPEYEGSAGDYNFFLYHKGDKNLIIEDHDEFGYGEMSCYILEDGKIKDGDDVSAGLAYSWDNAEDSEDIAPVFLPVNMNKVLVIEEVGGEEGESITCYLSVSEDGKLSLSEIDEDSDKDEDNSDAGSLKVPESEEELFAFMEGEWDFINPVTLEDYAHMEIDDKGSFVYGYTGSKESCTGEFVANHLYVEEDVPLTFTVNVSGLDGMTFEYSGYVIEDEDSSDGKIYYGSCDGEDYIYMEETGNGDTFAGSVLFQDPGTVDGSFHMGSNSYIMHRKSNADTTAELKDGEFYAWVWKSDDKGLWAQEMKPLTWDDENEYTCNRYTAAAFMPGKMGSAYYEYSKDIDKKLLLNGRRLDMENPRYMCLLKVSSDGVIEDIQEVDDAFYGMYDLGDLDPEISFEGETFTYNGIDIDVSDLGGGMKINNVYSAYGKIIIECYISHHENSYLVFDKFRGEIVQEYFNGNNLTWIGDDFTTAIYSDGNEIRDLCGDLMHYIECEEIESLEFTDDGKSVKCTYTIWDDKKQDEETKVETFELPERRDEAMNAYSDYVDSGRASDYRRFMEYAPDGAKFFVLTDPQIWTGDVFYVMGALDESAVNKVMIVALSDNTYFEIQDDDADIVAYDYIDRGSGRAYLMTMSEGMPLYTIYVSTYDDNYEEVVSTWEVTMISGETYQHCLFVE